MNFLVVMLDDARRDIVDTMPTLRSLARRGVTFTRAYSETPVCYSARANFLRGQSSATTQIVDWFGVDVTAAITAGRWDHDETFASWITSHECLMVGKYLNTSEEFIPQPAGWDRWVQPDDPHEHFWSSVNDGAGFDAVSPAQWHIDRAVTEITDLIDTAVGDWLAYWPVSSPHSPHAANPDDIHAWSFVEPIIYTQTGTDWPSWIEALPQIVNWSTARTIRRAMVREAYLVDQAIATIVAHLTSANQLEDTIIIVTSDNGAHQGDHRIVGNASKNTLYEPAFGIPMVCAGPGFPSTGIDVDVLVNLQDITKTLTAAAGATAPHALSGTDLRDIAASPGSYASRVLLGQRKPISDDLPACDFIVTPTRKLGRYDTTGDDEYEMYDLDTDPGELINVADVAERLTERNALEAQLDALL